MTIGKFRKNLIESSFIHKAIDTISRQAAIDAFDCSVGGVPVEFVKYVSEYADKMMSRIKALPSAQPEIVRCKYCKHHWTYKCMDSMPIERCDLEQTFYDVEHDFCNMAERKKK